MKNHLNLLPLGFRRRRLLHRRLRQWAIAWIACVLGLSAVGAIEQVTYRQSRRSLEALRQAAIPLQGLLEENESYKADLATLQQRGTLLQKVRDDKPLLTLISAASESVGNCNGQLYIQEVSFERNIIPAQKQDNSVRGSGKQAKSGATNEVFSPWGHVTFVGEANHNVAIATFVAGLRDSGLFRQVELKSSILKGSEKSRQRTYVVQCEI